MWFKKDSVRKTGKNVYILLDRSGSMATSWLETLGSINGYVEKLEDDVNVYLAAFDSAGDKPADDYLVLRETTAKKFDPLTEKEVSARGGTPLYDAVGRISEQMLKDNAERAVLVIMTDGYENTSKEYNLDSIKAKLKELERKDWPTVMLGADFKNVTSYATGTFNISSSNVVNTSKAMRGFAMNTLAGKTESYFSSIAGTTASLNAMKWTDTEKAKIENEDENDIQVKVIPLVGDTSGHA